MTRSFVGGLLMGTLIGMAVGLLLAPERGEETRRRVRSRAQPVVYRTRDVVTGLARRAGPPAEEGEPTPTPKPTPTPEP